MTDLESSVIDGGAAVLELEPAHADDMGRIIAPCALSDFLLAVEACGFRAEVFRQERLRDANLSDAGALYQYLTRDHLESRRIERAAAPDSLRRLLNLPVANRAYVTSLARSLASGKCVGRLFRDAIWDGLSPQTLEEAQIAGLNYFLVIGDSHSSCYVKEIKDERLVPLHLLCPGATIMRLGLEDARSGFGRKILNWLRDNSATLRNLAVPVFLKFGQGDIEFVCPLRRMSEQRMAFSLTEFEEFADECLDRYFEFIDKILFFVGPDLLRVCSIFPPTLSTAEGVENYGSKAIDHVATAFNWDAASREAFQDGMRQLEMPDLSVRTNMHAIFNAKLQLRCARRNIRYVDDFSPLIDWTGTVASEFIRDHNGLNDHLRYGDVDRVIRPLLKRYCGATSRGHDSLGIV